MIGQFLCECQNSERASKRACCHLPFFYLAKKERVISVMNAEDIGQGHKTYSIIVNTGEETKSGERLRERVPDSCLGGHEVEPRLENLSVWAVSCPSSSSTD